MGFVSQHELLPPHTPLALQLGETLADVVHRHFKELVRQILVSLTVAGRRVEVVDKRLPLYRLQKADGESGPD